MKHFAVICKCLSRKKDHSFQHSLCVIRLLYCLFCWFKSKELPGHQRFDTADKCEPEENVWHEGTNRNLF